MEACLELAGMDGVVAMQDLGAAGLTCALAELTARGGVGAEVDLDRVPRRESGMSPYEVLLSESQERMLIVVRPDAVGDVRRVFARYELEAATIGEITDGELISLPLLLAMSSARLPGGPSRTRCELFESMASGPIPEPFDLEPLAAEPATRIGHARAPRIGECARSQADLAAIRPHEWDEYGSSDRGPATPPFSG